MAAALRDLEARFRAGTLDAVALDSEQRDRLSRRARVEELAELVGSLA